MLSMQTAKEYICPFMFCFGDQREERSWQVFYSANKFLYRQRVTKHMILTWAITISRSNLDVACRMIAMLDETEA